ncbi:hypothetical protein F5B18DRAFT_670544 [Nemania serpens]|nr:hypothetical protein F5B18DRAFT_670544 [Nemania serpens]
MTNMPDTVNVSDRANMSDKSSISNHSDHPDRLDHSDHSDHSDQPEEQSDQESEQQSDQGTEDESDKEPTPEHYWGGGQEEDSDTEEAIVARRDMTFPQFTRLPPELRLMIWELALPDRRILCSCPYPLAIDPWIIDYDSYAPEILNPSTFQPFPLA